MAQRTSPPFRADHVGSLLRPPRAARRRATTTPPGEIDADELRAVEDEAIRDVVRMQEEVGLQSATDGEFRRASWHMDFIYQLDGITQGRRRASRVQFHNADGDIEFTPAAMHVDGKLGVSRDDLRRRLPLPAGRGRRRPTPKLTIPSPSMVHYRGGRAAIDPAVYPDLDAFWADLTAAYAEQVRALGELGCTLPAVRRHEPRLPQRPAASASTSPRSAATPSTSTSSTSATSTRRSRRGPTGMAVTTHMCRGNFRSSWVAEGGYDFVAEALFNELDVDGFFMEWDDERSGGFEPLRFVPKGKQVVLGLVTTKRGELEAKDELKRRIEEASRQSSTSTSSASRRSAASRRRSRATRSPSTSRSRSCGWSSRRREEVWG